MVFPITGGTQDTAAYDVSNSLRFNDADTPSLTLDLSGGAGNRKTWTASFWFKLGNQDASGASNQRFLSANTSHSDTNYGQIGISNNDTFEFGTGTHTLTSRKIRKIIDRITLAEKDIKFESIKKHNILKKNQILPKLSILFKKIEKND